jgi:hypothetical protein
MQSQRNHVSKESCIFATQMWRRPGLSTIFGAIDYVVSQMSKMSKAPWPRSFLLLLERGATVDAIVVFGLQCEMVAVHADGQGVEEKFGRTHDGAFVSDFFAKETNVQAVPRSVSVGIGNGLDQFVGKYIVVESVSFMAGRRYSWCVNDSTINLSNFCQR